MNLGQLVQHTILFLMPHRANRQIAFLNSKRGCSLQEGERSDALRSEHRGSFFSQPAFIRTSASSIFVSNRCVIAFSFFDRSRLRQRRNVSGVGSCSETGSVQDSSSSSSFGQGTIFTSRVQRTIYAAANRQTHRPFGTELPGSAEGHGDADL